MTWLLRLLRRFDLEYWRTKETLGQPVPSWVDRRWPTALDGNGGVNPFRCGDCKAQRLWPQLFAAHQKFTQSQEQLNASLVCVDELTQVSA